MDLVAFKEQTEHKVSAVVATSGIWEVCILRLSIPIPKSL